MNKNNLIKYRKTIIFSVAIFLFILLTFTIFNNSIQSIDTKIENIILNIRKDNLTNIMILITNISSAYCLTVISILLLVFIKDKKIPINIIKNLIYVFLLSQLTKIIMQRPRPEGINLIDATGFSYPSGHSMVSMAYFGFISYLIYKKLNHKLSKIILITTLFIIIFLVGFSRIYLGVHYLSDVIGGFLLSIAYLMLYIKLNNKSEVIK